MRRVALLLSGLLFQAIQVQADVRCPGRRVRVETLEEIYNLSISGEVPRNYVRNCRFEIDLDLDGRLDTILGENSALGYCQSLVAYLSNADGTACRLSDDIYASLRKDTTTPRTVQKLGRDSWCLVELRESSAEQGAYCPIRISPIDLTSVGCKLYVDEQSKRHAEQKARRCK